MLERELHLKLSLQSDLSVGFLGSAVFAVSRNLENGAQWSSVEIRQKPVSMIMDPGVG